MKHVVRAKDLGGRGVDKLNFPRGERRERRERERERERKTERKKERRKDRQTDRQTDRKKERKKRERERDPWDLKSSSSSCSRATVTAAQQ